MIKLKFILYIFFIRFNFMKNNLFYLIFNVYSLYINIIIIILDLLILKCNAF